MKEWVMYIKLLLYMWNINIFFYVLYDEILSNINIHSNLNYNLF